MGRAHPARCFPPDRRGSLDYLVVSGSIPEQLNVWRDGQFIYNTPVNTGVSGAATALGTYPVYSRFLTTTMTGTDPDGYHYTAPNVPWVAYFNGGDAVDGYPRAVMAGPRAMAASSCPFPMLRSSSAWTR